MAPTSLVYIPIAPLVASDGRRPTALIADPSFGRRQLRIKPQREQDALDYK